MVGLTHCDSQLCCSQSTCPCVRPLLTSGSTGDTQTLYSRFGSVSVGSLGPGLHKVLFEPSKCLWWIWGLILNVISPVLPSCWDFSFALGCGVSFLGGIHYSPVDGCSGVSCNFGVLAGEDEHTSFYSTILFSLKLGKEYIKAVYCHPAYLTYMQSMSC